MRQKSITTHGNLGLDATKPVFRVSNKARYSNQSSQLQRIARKIEISLVASLVMILSKMQITQALTSLCRCAGWSTPLLFANLEDRFSRIEAHLICDDLTVSGIKIMIFNHLLKIAALFSLAK